MHDKMCKLADLANAEFRSSRVKKQTIKRKHEGANNRR